MSSNSKNCVLCSPNKVIPLPPKTQTAQKILSIPPDFVEHDSCQVTKIELSPEKYADVTSPHSNHQKIASPEITGFEENLKTPTVNISTKISNSELTPLTVDVSAYGTEKSCTKTDSTSHRTPIN
jgi:hypothetical protein